MRLFAVILLLAMMVCGARAATINAASTGWTDVSNAVFLASPTGDTVQLPNGDSTWEGPILIQGRAIRFTGNGVANTIIRDGANVPAYFLRIDLDIAGTAGIATEVDNIKFLYDDGYPYTDRVQIFGNMTNHFINWHDTQFGAHAGSTFDGGLFFLDSVLGVIHHNRFYNGGLSSVSMHTKGTFFHNTAGDNDVGNRSYWYPDFFGALSVTNFIYIEHNFFTNSSIRATMDGQAGARYVYRFNTNYNGTIETHGSEAAERGGRAFEVYKNYFHGDGARSTPFYCRGGVWLSCSNIFTNWAGPGSTVMALLDNRISEHLFEPYEGATGENPWDVNVDPSLSDTVTTSTDNTLNVAGTPAYLSPDNSVKNLQVVKTGGPSVKSVTSMSYAAAVVTVSCTGHGFSNTVSSVYQIVSGGTGYTVNDVLTLTAGSGVGRPAQLTATTVVGGVVTVATVTQAGHYSTLPFTELSGTATVTGGTGSGATFNLAYFHPMVSFWGANEYGYNRAGFNTTSTDGNTFNFGVTVALPASATGTIKCTRGNNFGHVRASTASSIQWNDSVYGPFASLRFSASDTFKLLRVSKGIDQISHWGGSNFLSVLYPDLLTGFAGVQSVTICSEWTNDYHNIGSITEIDWSNEYTGGNFTNVVNGRNYTNNTPLAGWQPLGVHPWASGNGAVVAAVEGVAANAAIKGFLQLRLGGGSSTPCSLAYADGETFNTTAEFNFVGNYLACKTTNISGAFTVCTIDLRITNVGGGAATEPLDVAFYTDSSDHPGSVVGSFSPTRSSAEITGDAFYTFTPTATLANNTIYWIVIRAGDTDVAAALPVDNSGEGIRDVMHSSDGTSWTDQESSADFNFRINRQ